MKESRIYFVTSKLIYSESSSPAVMYWEGALAPEDRKAPEYLQMEANYHKTKKNKQKKTH